MSLNPQLLRWSARITGLAVAVGYVAIVVGHLIEPEGTSPTMLREWLGILLLSIACLAVVIAWRWPLAGGLVSLAGLIAFVIVIRLQQPLVIAAVAIPAVLSIFAALAGRRHSVSG